MTAIDEATEFIGICNQVSAERDELAATQDQVRTLDLLFKQECEKAMRATNGNVVEAAAMLGIAKTTLYRWLKEWGVKAGKQ